MFRIPFWIVERPDTDSQHHLSLRAFPRIPKSGGVGQVCSDVKALESEEGSATEPCHGYRAAVIVVHAGNTERLADPPQPFMRTAILKVARCIPILIAEYPTAVGRCISVPRIFISLATKVLAC